MAEGNPGEAIYFTAQRGDREPLRKLLLANPTFADAYHFQRGETALFAATRAGSIDCLRLLLAAGADVNRQRTDGETVLMLAAELSNVRAAQTFLAAGCDVNLQSVTGVTALMKAAADASIEGLRPNQKSVLEVLLDHGADPNAQDACGKGALTFAGDVRGETGAGGAVSALIAAGAKPNIKDAGGAPPLHVVTSVEATRALLDGGANVDLRAEGGVSAMHTAARDGRTAALRLVVAHGADLTIVDAAGDSPLAVARRNRNVSAADMLEARMNARLGPLLADGLHSRTTKGPRRLQNALRMAEELGHEVDPEASAADAAAALLAQLVADDDEDDAPAEATAEPGTAAELPMAKAVVAASS